MVEKAAEGATYESVTWYASAVSNANPRMVSVCPPAEMLGSAIEEESKVVANTREQFPTVEKVRHASWLRV